MNIDQIACITWTIRASIQTADDFRASMSKLSRIGYRAVQISAMPEGLLTEEEIARICADNGLTICATHEPGPRILDEPERIVDRLQRLGCRYTAYPYPRDITLNDAAALDAFAKRLDHSGKILREAGQVLTYHNHAHEFVKVNGLTALEHIYKKTDSTNLQAEIDTYWVQLGGGNPVTWCQRLTGRLPLLHLKDVAVVGDKPTYAAIGSGNLDIPAIIKAAEASGCQWFIVEQDECPGDPFASLAESFNYLTTLAHP